MAVNVHGTAVVLGDRGVLIMGASGAGKTRLALTLMEMARQRGYLARLVADDQLFLRVCGAILLVETPPSIRNLVEIHGLGPVDTPSEHQAVVDLAVELVEMRDAPRFQEASTVDLAGILVPSLVVPARNAASAAAVVLAQLKL